LGPNFGGYCEQAAPNSDVEMAENGKSKKNAKSSACNVKPNAPFPFENTSRCCLKGKEVVSLRLHAAM
jgi:hypothetical protein